MTKNKKILVVGDGLAGISLAEKIAEWKAAHGGVYKLTADDGKVAYIRDPLSDMNVMKMAFSAKNKIAYVQIIITNCWLEGDEDILKIERYVNGMEDQVNDITDIPESKVTRSGNKFIIEVEGFTCEVRAALRADIILSDQKNAAKEPFETAINLLRLIEISGVDPIRKNTRAFIGLLTAIDKVKDKAFVNVEKL